MRKIVVFFAGSVLSLGMFAFDSSSKSDKVLFVFGGSDWCSNCIALEKKILSDPQFVSTLENHNIALEKIDFPQRKRLPASVVKYNSSIAEKFKFKGVYPTLIVFSATTNTYKTIVYQNENVESFSAKVIREAEALHE